MRPVSGVLAGTSQGSDGKSTQRPWAIPHRNDGGQLWHGSGVNRQTELGTTECGPLAFGIISICHSDKGVPLPLDFAQVWCRICGTFYAEVRLEAAVGRICLFTLKMAVKTRHAANACMIHQCQIIYGIIIICMQFEKYHTHMYYNYIYHSVYAFVIIYQYIYINSVAPIQRKREMYIYIMYVQGYVCK